MLRRRDRDVKNELNEKFIVILFAIAVAGYACPILRSLNTNDLSPEVKYCLRFSFSKLKSENIKDRIDCCFFYLTN